MIVSPGAVGMNQFILPRSSRSTRKATRVPRGYRVTLFTAAPDPGPPGDELRPASKRAGRSLEWHRRGTATFPGACGGGDRAVAGVVAAAPDRPGIYQSR